MPAARLPRWVNRYPPRGFAPRSAGRYTKPCGSPLLTTGTTSAVPLRGVNFARRSGVNIESRLTGGRSYVLLRDVGGRSKRVSIGPVSTMTVAEARRECLARQASPEPDSASGPTRAPLLRDFVANEWRQAHFDRYKPSTKKGVRSVLEGRMLPAFGSKQLDRITPAQVRKWFDAFSRAAPGNANSALKLLRQIMNFAIACGYIDANPMRGIRRNRRPALTRFLSREEIGRLHKALDRQTRKGGREQADIIRLLLLTGCRKGEIVRLRWSEVDGDRLVLADGKTGPRTLPLNTQARRILERQPRDGSSFVFPSPRDPSRPRSRNLALWYRVRREAGHSRRQIQGRRKANRTRRLKPASPTFDNSSSPVFWRHLRQRRTPGRFSKWNGSPAVPQCGQAKPSPQRAFSR